ncbi:unnamed protein product [Euphydryas editha]|uniref:RNA-directed DNA polymerase n=1 Tax=Euphydryas editha TaxID=104508 RepID=A0AAU9TEV2_EUPED|nr:unnamed protein product [Euphydryas editha]
MDHKSVKFSEFNPKTDIWDNYIDRLKFCFEANGILLDGARRANFFTVCGAEVFETFLALITPRKASEVTFTEIEKILTKHYSPKPNEISMSYKFYTRNQNTNETASEYIAQLRKISSSCNFKELERMLRDRLVCGMKDQRLQYELLKRDSLSYQDVVDAMLSSESAGKDCRMIQLFMGDEIRSNLNRSTDDKVQDCKLEPMDVNAVQPKSSKRFCYRCGDRHGGECRFINAQCRYCKKTGHIEKVCILKKKSMRKNINFTEDENDFHLNGIYNFKNEGRTPSFVVHLLLEGMPVDMQLDTGASFSLINEHTWRIIQAQRQHLVLNPSSLSLRTWTNTPVILLGQAIIKVQFRDITQNLSIIIAKGRGPNLLGRDWLGPLQITMNINNISMDNMVQIENIISKYGDVFQDGLGTFRGEPVNIHLKTSASPKFLKARPVPYAIKADVEKEIDRLVSEGVLQPVSYSEWATPVVPIRKKSGEIRLCGDYRSTVNQVTESDTYPMPTANEVFATVAGAQFFTTLDLERAYTQVKVSESTAKLLTLNTCKGLYTVHRLPFGVKACPGVFQRLMTSLLAGISGVAVLIDDIIISGRTMLVMQQRLEEVLYRIQKAGLRLNKNKCKFAQEQVEFLGFVINKDGIHPAPSKVEAIVKTPEPKNVQELQAFLGLYNFYERFIPHKATVLEPLHRLLDKSHKWKWTKCEKDSFDTAKHLLTFDTTLVHYDLNRPLILVCDSSEYGVGAVLSHIMDDGHERPVAMSSRTLHTHERRYSQLDKEAAAIMFGIQKFHNYLAGRYFTVVTDHKPLLGIFNPKKPMPVILSPRLTRIAIALTSHDYDIVYRPGTQIGNADSLSRWPLPVSDQEEQPLYDILLMADKTEDFPYTAKEIALETEKDQILSRIVRYLRCGWPNKVTDTNLHTYWLHRSKLSLQDGCILLGCRVVIPPSLRQPILKMLHTTHNGIVHTKSLARSYVWWPHLDNDIINLVSNCRKCLENRQMPAKSNHEWVLPSRPWSRIHMDFAGPFLNKTFLIVVDAYSRWPEVFIVNNTTSSTVIRHLRMLFATHGLCETIVSDNGTAFMSNEMGIFLNANKIRHVTTAPYHPATNGLAERMVQTVKNKLKKIEGSWDVRIPNMLLGLRVTPCTSTNKSPAELLLNRRLRTVIDNLHPDYLQHRKMESQIINMGQKKNRETNIGENVMYRNYNQNGSKWLPGQIINKEGPSNYRVQTDNGAIVRRHIDQIVKLKNNDSKGESEANARKIQNDVTEELETEAIEPAEISNGADQQGEHTEYDDIIEIPSAERWEQMLGIPRSSEITMAGGKIRNKLNVHAKVPYSRPTYSRQDTNYMF